MPSIEFDDESKLGSPSSRLLYAKFQKSADTPFVVSLLIKSHIVKNEAGARKLLLAVVIIILAISAYLIKGSFDGPVFIDKITR